MKTMNFREFDNVLNNNNFHCIRSRGSHFIYERDGKKISVNKDINKMVAKRLIKENDLCLI